MPCVHDYRAIIVNLNIDHKTGAGSFGHTALLELVFYAKITGDPNGIHPEPGGRMSQTTSSAKPPSRLKRILLGQTDDSKGRPSRRPGAASPSTETGSRFGSRLLPAFWTVASVVSMVVNLVLIAILLIALRMLGTLQLTANDQFSGVLGGMYHNFVRMDQAAIISNIPVQESIPLDIVVPVQTTTRIFLAESVVIPNAHVRINTGTVSIDADAEVTLPAETPLNVRLDFPLTVRNSIPISINVPVNIPLSQTQLHEPFVGLQEVVRPYYCLVEPNATLNNVQICSPLASPVLQPTPTLPIIP
jgi:hypothetical protein